MRFLKLAGALLVPGMALVVFGTGLIVIMAMIFGGVKCGAELL